MAANLRGVRESGTAFAIPTYAFMVAILGMAAFGLLPAGVRRPARRSRARSFELTAEGRYSDGLAGLAGAFLLLRAFSSGCAALTGVEAISNGVPAFRKPKRKNAATTLLLLGTIAVTMMLEHHRAGQDHAVCASPRTRSTQLRSTARRACRPAAA